MYRKMRRVGDTGNLSLRLTLAPIGEPSPGIGLVPALFGCPLEAIGPKSRPGDSGQDQIAPRNELVADGNALSGSRKGLFGFRKELFAREQEHFGVESELFSFKKALFADERELFGIQKELSRPLSEPLLRQKEHSSRVTEAGRGAHNRPARM
jgi:hypothetical protein